ncbi:MAG: RNA 2'-phosphotransferase [Polyangiales bacterium]
MSWLLRHGAREAKLSMDAAGWASIDDVLSIVRVPRPVLDDVVRENNKSRYELLGDRIRACQGHSLAGTPVTLEALEASWTLDARVEPVWHGTHAGALASIAAEGLLPGERTHVHLAGETDSKVGKRAGVGVLLPHRPRALAGRGGEPLPKPERGDPRAEGPVDEHHRPARRESQGPQSGERPQAALRVRDASAAG